MKAVRLAAALALALSGCVAMPPAPPPLSPIAEAKTFGYSETPKGEDGYVVTYVTPPRRTLGDDTETARTIGRDMATWRAAQLAEARGFKGFAVTNQQSTATVYPEPVDFDYPPNWGPFWRPFRSPFWGPPAPWLTARLLVTARVSIDVKLLQAPGPADFDAVQTIARLRAAYPDAETGAAPK